MTDDIGGGALPPPFSCAPPRSTEEAKMILARYLPGQIAKTLLDYARFVDAPPPEDAKGFVAHQSACKAALAHVEALAKLARWADSAALDDPLGEPLDDQEPTDRDLISEARQMLSTMEDLNDQTP